ncbi:MAG: 16S rRNA (adenine(1518)-N(6)/adenine(1519)-N(6))-dimethyltransferase RsmA [Bacteroidota bacterium]|nr:16S rRNA (adenine(1518)-N(6)/adenine(1519)-N(6))-dimethyltransferase RsmA [Bacteroidota bacterium]MDQ6889760.1 16S rRNA (adenine(1518)-N(6)/adenine(1519)-N(6))-dimethyltransferase RsmA [Bacteroidota bacterium]
MYTLKKSLGQHFLKDEKIVEKIISSLKEHAFKNLLEVGPGGGALTRHLLKIPGIHLKAVELDGEKVNYLLTQFPGLRDNLINKSFLEMERPFEEPFTVIGNFPYNISTQILFKVLEWKEYVPAVIGMFQKEVAERAAAKEGSKVYGVLSVLLQYYYNVEYLFSVGNECFTPQPKVQSGVIRLTSRGNYLPVKSERAFWVLVKTAFNQRRKTLRNGVKSLFSKEVLTDELFNRRAETLSVKEFAALTFKMS